jgi:hypothetical protein
VNFLFSVPKFCTVVHPFHNDEQRQPHQHVQPRSDPWCASVMAPWRSLVLANFSWLIISTQCSNQSIGPPSTVSLPLCLESKSTPPHQEGVHHDVQVLHPRVGGAGRVRTAGVDETEKRPSPGQTSRNLEGAGPEGPPPLLDPHGPARLSIDAARDNPVTSGLNLVLHAPSRPELPSQRRRTGLLLSLGAVSGLAHVLCSFKYEYYANMMTGNTIRGTLAASRGDANQAMFFGAVVLSYLLGASIYRALDLFLLHQSSDVSTSAQDAAADPYFDRHKLRNLSWTWPISLAIFCSSDVAYRWMGRRFSAKVSKTIMLRLSSLAIGFGMVNAAAQDSLNTVTNAATGHITRLGVGVADRALLWRVGCAEREAKFGSEVFRPVSPVVAAARSSADATSTSGQFLAVLLSSLVMSSIACRRRWIPLDELDPALGALFGILYATLLFWYTSPFVEPPWRRAVPP